MQFLLTGVSLTLFFTWPTPSLPKHQLNCSLTLFSPTVLSMGRMLNTISSIPPWVDLTVSKERPKINESFHQPMDHAINSTPKQEFPLWLSRLRTRPCLFEEAGWIPGLPQWVKDAALLQAVDRLRMWFGSGVAMPVCIGLSCSSDSTP